MSERYTKLFNLPENLYASNAPVIIAAGALLKDNINGNIVAQLKIKSIANKIIKAAKVQIQPLDTVGKPLGKPFEYHYLDLNVARDADFGTKAAIELPDTITRRFTVSVLSIAYTDNTVWETNGEAWEPLPKQTSLNTYLNDIELVHQYKLKFIEKAHYQPDEVNGLWRCTCGAINIDTEKTCHDCRLERTALFTLDISALTADKDIRVEQERIAAEEKAKEEKAAAEVRKKEEKAAAEARKKAHIKIGIISGTGVVLAIAVILLLTQIVIPANKYNNAMALMDEEQYIEAMKVFESLGNYKDAADQAAKAYQMSIPPCEKLRDYIVKNGTDLADETDFLGFCCKINEPIEGYDYYCGAVPTDDTIYIFIKDISNDKNMVHFDETVTIKDGILRYSISMSNLNTTTDIDYFISGSVDISSLNYGDTVTPSEVMASDNTNVLDYVDASEYSDIASMFVDAAVITLISFIDDSNLDISIVDLGFDVYSYVKGTSPLY